MKNPFREIWNRLQQIPPTLERHGEILIKAEHSVLSVLAEVRELRAYLRTPSEIVIWGSRVEPVPLIPYGVKRRGKYPRGTRTGLDRGGDTGSRTRHCVFTIPVQNGRAEFFPQTLFTLSRWLLIGPGRVRSVLIGEYVQTPTPEGVSGITGRYGEGDFESADVGNRIAFEVES